jgi:hypothetical protein
VGTGAQFSRGLGSTQQQLTHDAKLLVTELEWLEFGVAETMLEFGDPAAEPGAFHHQPLPDQAIHRFLDLALIQPENRLTVAFLVARRKKGIQ